MTTWQTDPNTGLTTVDFGSGPQVPVFTDTKTLNTLKTKVVDQWGTLIASYAAASNVPFATIASTILQESGGNPRALNPGDTPNGAGLMQITSAVLRKGHTNEELFDPNLNLSIGVPYFASGWVRGGQDLPKAAGAFNAGGARDCGVTHSNCCKTCCEITLKNGTKGCAFCQCNADWAGPTYPLGINATKGYVSNIVKGANTVIQQGWVPGGTPPPPPIPPDPGGGLPPLQSNVAGSSPANGMLWFFVAGLSGYFVIKHGVPLLMKRRRR